MGLAVSCANLVVRRRYAAFPRWRALFLLAIVLGILLRIYLSTTGHNHDVCVQSEVLFKLYDGQSLYTTGVEGAPFNYGPIFPYVFLRPIKTLERTLAPPGPQAFHTSLATFLTLVDVLIACLLARTVSIRVATFFFLFPGSIYVTGYHSQIENLAILLALGSYLLLLRRGERSWFALVGASLLLGFSLATKHIFGLFPLWILVARSPIPLRRRGAYVFLSFATFAACLLPFVFEQGGAQAVIEGIGGYRGHIGNGVCAKVLLAVEAQLSSVGLSTGLEADWPGLRFLFIGAISGLAFRAGSRAGPLSRFGLYTMAMLALSPAMAYQYLTLPAFACALFWRSWLSWGNAAVVTLFLLGPDQPQSWRPGCTQVPLLAFLVLFLMGRRPWQDRIPSLTVVLRRLLPTRKT